MRIIKMKILSVKKEYRLITVLLNVYFVVLLFGEEVDTREIK